MFSAVNVTLSACLCTARQREEAESSVKELLSEVKGGKAHPLIEQLEAGASSSGTGGGMEKLMQLPKVAETEAEGAGGAAAPADTKAGDRRKSGLMSLLSKKEKDTGKEEKKEAVVEEEEEEVAAEHKARRGMDLATTLERIQKNFVITDPRLPENPIVSGNTAGGCN